ncbi:MAG TPA: hypothetical protein VIK55_06725 [Paludibacter sp.]
MKYRVHNEAMRKADAKFHEERDKRYSSENELRAMALRIKETADAKALDLASQIQTYKDDKADKTREQSLSERGAYVTHGDLAAVFSKTENQLTSFIDEMRGVLKPVLAHIAEDKGAGMSTNKLYAGITILAVIIGVVFTFVNYLIK